MAIDPLIGAPQVRSLCNHISDMTLYRWLEAGTFPQPAARINRRRYWRASDVTAWLEAQQIAA